MNAKVRTVICSVGLLLVTVIWGVAFVFVKNGLDLIPPIWMVALRFTVASICLSLVFCKKLAHASRHELKSGIVIGIWLFLAYVTQTYGCKYTTAGKNAFLTTIYVILVPFINWVLIKKKPDGFTVVAAVLSITGIGFLSLQGDLSVNIGDVLTLVCGFCYAMQIVDIARYAEDCDPITLAIIQMILTAVLSWISAPILEGGFPAAALTDSGAVGGILYLGLGSTMLAYLLQNVCQKYVPASTAAILMSFESVFGMLASVILLGETLGLRGTVGCVLMFF
ncbi:MAG: DMT family transporter, partial [Treponemataceae bacterium]|nr:DMT family transporter [Treponemataceae bacterium]